MERTAKRPFGLTLVGIWTGGLSIVLSAYFGLALIGSFAPTDFPTDPITTNETTMIVVNLVAGLVGVIIGFALMRRWGWSYWMGWLFHVFIIVNVLINEVQFAALASPQLRMILIVGGLVVSVLSLLTLMYLTSRRGVFRRDRQAV